jgi:hypothetical protein
MYINTTTNQYPVSQSEIRAAHPNISFPVPFTPPAGYSWVFPAPQPPYDPVTQGVCEIAPALTDKGHWEQQWQVYAFPAETAALNQAAKAQQIKDSITQATQARLDAFAQARGYDDIKSATGYAGCSVPRFSIEGVYARDIRAQTWAVLFDIMDQVVAKTRPMPSGYADIEAELPALVWPAV